MATSSEVVAKRRREEAWESYMAGLRAEEAARITKQQAPSPQTTPPAEKPETPSNG